MFRSTGSSVVIATLLTVSFAVLNPVIGQIASSDQTFNEAVQAVKDKNFQHAVKLFRLQAENDQHDAQFNLALLLEAGKGSPQNFADALTWAWSAKLGGIERAGELAQDLVKHLPEKSLQSVREQVLDRLKSRIDNGQVNAIPQIATFHLDMLEEPDYETAYIWYSIGVAFGLKSSLEARDEARQNIEEDKVIDLQHKAGAIYQRLKASLD